MPVALVVVPSARRMARLLGLMVAPKRRANDALRKSAEAPVSSKKTAEVPLVVPARRNTPPVSPAMPPAAPICSGAVVVSLVRLAEAEFVEGVIAAIVGGSEVGVMAAKGLGVVTVVVAARAAERWV